MDIGFRKEIFAECYSVAFYFFARHRQGGDTIDIDFTAGIVYRNGEALDEPYTAEPTYLYESVDFPITVPDGCLFLMGDNRNNSTDSRDTRVGCVDERDIMGAAVLRVLPFGKIGAAQ